METKSTFLQAGAATIALYGFAAPAYAYLDPGTGSMILSAVVGLVATLGLALKTYWYKLRNFFRPADEEEPVPEEPDPAPRHPQ